MERRKEEEEEERKSRLTASGARARWTSYVKSSRTLDHDSNHGAGEKPGEWRDAEGEGSRPDSGPAPRRESKRDKARGASASVAAECLVHVRTRRSSATSVSPSLGISAQRSSEGDLRCLDVCFWPAEKADVADPSCPSPWHGPFSLARLHADARRRL